MILNFELKTFPKKDNEPYKSGQFFNENVKSISFSQSRAEILMEHAIMLQYPYQFFRKVHK